MTMTLSAFPYPGGKTLLTDWIVEQIPDHHVYVEPFGGSAAVLLNKPRSSVEVYNDIDGDIVQFFDVARERPDELIEWARRTPYSEELYNRWVTDYYNGNRPDDPVERAGRWLFLRFTQFGGKYDHTAGFKRDQPRKKKGSSHLWRTLEERVDAISERLQGVSIQNGDYQDIIEKYDSENTVFYRRSRPSASGLDPEGEGRTLIMHTTVPTSTVATWVKDLNPKQLPAVARKCDTSQHPATAGETGVVGRGGAADPHGRTGRSGVNSSRPILGRSRGIKFACVRSSVFGRLGQNGEASGLVPEVLHCDPPYLSKEHTYRVRDFDHGELADALSGIDGYAMVSYTDVPDGYTSWTELTRTHNHESDQDPKRVTERLFLNFVPERTARFAGANQTRLTEVQ